MVCKTFQIFQTTDFSLYIRKDIFQETLICIICLCNNTLFIVLFSYIQYYSNYYYYHPNIS